MLVIYFVATHMEAFIDGLSQFAINLLSSPNGELKAFLRFAHRRFGG